MIILVDQSQKTMSESTTTKNVTPSIRSVVSEASPIISSNEIHIVDLDKNSSSPEPISRERRSSTSSFTSNSSSTDSMTSYAVNREADGDNESSNDDVNQDWLQLHERINALRLLSKFSSKQVLFQNH